MYPAQIIAAFDKHLSQNNLQFTAIVVGGCALALMNCITRETQDVDVLEPKIPQEILNSAHDFANQWNQVNRDVLKINWLNNGPASLQRDLPIGWDKRVEIIFQGKSLTLYTLCRSDLLISKLFAYCDRVIDKNDCIKLNPTREELLTTFEWVKELDGNPMWPTHVRSMFEDLAKELGHEL